MTTEIASLKADNRDLEDRLYDLRQRHEIELEALRATNARLEERLSEEKEGRRRTEDQLTKLHSERDSTIRDAEDKADIRAREAQRKAKADAEDEWKDRLKSAENRWSDELSDARSETAAVKRRLDDALREADEARRRVSLYGIVPVVFVMSQSSSISSLPTVECICLCVLCV
jgi:chromosome segregation ATPase